MDVLVTDVLADGDVQTAKILQSVFARLTGTFADEKDINAIMNLLTDPLIQENLSKGPFINHVDNILGRIL